MHTLPGSPVDFHKRSTAIARHYGFLPVDELVRIKQTGKGERGRLEIAPEHRKMDPFGGDLASVLSRSHDKNLFSSKEPLFVYHTNLGKTSSLSPLRAARFGMHIIGTRQSLGEALIIKATYAILEESGIKNSCVHVNSIGDKDSSAKYLKEAVLFLKKHVDDLPPAIREIQKDDVHSALIQLVRKDHPLSYEMPRPVEFLTSPSRRHFREVIEFIESAAIPYEIDDRLLGHRDCFSQTLFEVHAEDHKTSTPYAFGGRLDEYARRTVKANVPTVGVLLAFKTPEEKGRLNPPPLPRASEKKPRVCFIHVGFEAKLKSLTVIETFRKAHIPFCQCLHHDKLTDQLAYAERISVPYTVIMGQKEAMTGMVIVRNVETRAQQTVSIDLLPAFFRSHAK